MDSFLREVNNTVIQHDGRYVFLWSLVHTAPPHANIISKT